MSLRDDSVPLRHMRDHCAEGAAVVLFLMFFLHTVSCVAAEDGQGAAAPVGTVAEERVLGPYLFRILEGENPDGPYFETLVISDGGRVLFQLSEEGIRFQEETVQELVLDGQTRRYALVKLWTGGAHCCFSYLIFHVDHPLFLLDRLNFGDYGEDDLKLRTDGHDLLVTAPDCAWNYFYSDFADSSSDWVELLVRPGGARPVPGQAHRTEWTPEEAEKRLEESVQTVKGALEHWEGFPYSLPATLWQEMLAFVCCGRADLAYVLLDRVWPESGEKKAEYRRDFEKNLRSSRLWTQIREANRW